MVLKLSAIVLALGAAAMSVQMPAFAADSEEEPALLFDLQSGGNHALSFSEAQLSEGDISVPVTMYIPENPGVNAISLKFQVNDGEINQEDVFGNYGFTLSEGKYSSPYCFDSENEGDPEKSFGSLFTTEKMNLNWIYSVESDSNVDALAEPGTVAWSQPDWAYDYSFAEATLVVPQGTPAGTYTFDIRKEQYVLSGSGDVKRYGQSQGVNAEGETVALESIPLVITVTEETAAPPSPDVTTEATTTETTAETTTAEAPAETTATENPVNTTLSGTEQTASDSESGGSVTTALQDPWVDDYSGMRNGYYLAMGDVCGKPGESVDVPIYVYGNTGCAGFGMLFVYDQALTLTAIDQDLEHLAIPLVAVGNVNIYPARYFAVTSAGHNETSVDGSVLIVLRFAIPEDAVPGTTYSVGFFREPEVLQDRFTVVDTDGKVLDADCFDGSITVVSDDSTPLLNRTNYSFSETGATVNLTVFHASGEVQWSSTDEEIASVDSNGFVRAKSFGKCEVIATLEDGSQLVCAIRIGLFGDVDANGQVTFSDAQLTLTAANNRVLGAPPNLTAEQEETADVIDDDVIAVSDAQAILTYYNSGVLGTEASWYELTRNPNAPDAPRES